MFMIGCFYHLSPEKSIFLFEAQPLASRMVAFGRPTDRHLNDTLEETS
jgi:hypothetical protein